MLKIKSDTTMNPLLKKDYWVLAGILALAAFFAACGGKSSSSSSSYGSTPTSTNTTTPSQASCTGNGTTIAISGNHGHALTVTKEDVIAGIEKSYDIQGAASHNHVVILTAQDFIGLKNDIEALEQSTTTLFHSHTITVTCAQ